MIPKRVTSEIVGSFVYCEPSMAQSVGQNASYYPAKSRLQSQSANHCGRYISREVIPNDRRTDRFCLNQFEFWSRC